MRIKLQTRVFLTFVLVVVLSSGLLSFLGARIISHTVLSEEQMRVTLDLRAAWSAVEGKLREVRQLVAAMVSVGTVQEACRGGDPSVYRRELEAIRRLGDLDFISVTDSTGRVVLRGVEPFTVGDDVSSDPLIYKALQGETASGFAIIGPERLRAGGRGLEERAFTVFEDTPMARQRPKDHEEAGMALVAAVPAFDDSGAVVGVAYGGVLLNRNYALVDRIRSIVFEDQKYKGRDLGTVTIFQWDVRIATNVVKPDGNRAIGTRVSSEVYEQVLENDRSWNDRAFVVDDWYISAYDPIHDAEGKVVGMLYVGVLARKYDDIKRHLWTIYIAVSLGTALIVIAVGFLFSRHLTGSLARLAHAADRIAEGDLDHEVPEPTIDDEVADLTRDFNSMAASLRDREARLKAANTNLEAANQSLQKLNANYLDMLSFVSHELKNTLGVIYTAAQSLDTGLVGELTEAQSRLAGSIARSIRRAVTMTRNYLDLSRIEKGELTVKARQLDFSTDVASPVLEDLAAAVADHKVEVVDELPASIPLSGDLDLLRIVYKNLLDNALKYGREGGTIRLGYSLSDGQHRFEVWNDGDGLAADQLGTLFQKFARPGKDGEARRKGTGLGLFITKEIVTKHGGTIVANSEEGEWMSFVFTLPADA